MITALTSLRPATSSPLVEPGATLRFGAALFYALLCVIIYERLSYRWAYFGFIWASPSIGEIIAAMTLAALPALALPRAAKNLFQFAAWALYFAVFAPSILIPVLQHLQASGEVWLLTGTIALGASVFALASRWPAKALPAPRQVQFAERSILGVLTGIFVLGYGFILVAHGAAIEFTSFADVYEQRAEFNRGAGGLMNYVVPMLANVVNPMLLAVGLKRRNPALIVLGIGGSVLSYGTFALKQHILTPFFVIGTYSLFNASGRCRISGIPLALITVSLLSLPFVATYDPVGGVMGTVLTMLFVRTLLLPGVITGLFSSYFSIYPHTYYAHSNIGRLFAHYPYGDLSVGQVVGYYLIPSNDGNLWELNGSFVVTDGIAALGITGIVVAFVICIAVMHLMARAAAKVEPAVIFPAAVPFLITLANTSLFSSMLTGGGIFLTLFLYLWGNARSPETADAAKRPASQAAA